MSKTMMVLSGGFQGLRSLPSLPELLKSMPDAVVALPAGPTVVAIDLGEPLRDLEMSFAPIRWNPELAGWLPTTDMVQDYATLFPRAEAAQTIALRREDPASAAGRKEVTIMLSLPGTYALVAFASAQAELPSRLRVTMSAGPSRISGGSGGTAGGATLEAWLTADGRNAAATVDGLLKSWPATGDLIYTGPPLQLPRSGNLALAFDAAWDGDGIIVRGRRFGQDVSEVFPLQPGKTVQGSVVFDAGPGIRLEKIRLGTAGAVSAGMGNKLGLGATLSGAVVLLVDDAIAKSTDVKLDYERSAIELAPAIGFDGKRQYRAVY